MSKDLAVKHDTLANTEELDELSQFMRDNANSGLDQLPDSDIIFPRLQILQPMSPLVTLQDQKPGTIANSVTEENYGASFEFYPLHAYATRMRWLTPEPGSNLDCVSQDYEHGTQKDASHGFGVCKNCSLGAWVEKTPPSCIDMRNFILLPANGDPSAQPIIFSAQRTGIKPAIQFITAMRGKPSYGSKWRLQVEKQSKDNKVWYTPKFVKVEDIANPARPGFDPREALGMLKTFKKMSDSIAESQARILLQQDNDVAPSHAAADSEEQPF